MEMSLIGDSRHSADDITPTDRRYHDCYIKRSTIANAW